MLLIKNIEFYETEQDPIEIIGQKWPHELVGVFSNEGQTAVPLTEIVELVKGRRFKRPSDGTDIVIGISKQAQDVIGLQYEAWDAMSKEMDSYYRQLMDERSTINRLKNATFWMRVKWVFTGCLA